MKLLLTSSGLLNTHLEKDLLNMTGNKTNLKVAIIPTAGDPIEWLPVKEGDTMKNYIARLNGENEQHMHWIRSYQADWEKRGYSVVIADLKEDPIELRKKLENVDIIDVTGGDVNWLLDWAKKSRLDTYLQDILNTGVIYIGTSAGSMLVTPDIGLTWWEPDNKLDHIGLGIVDFLTVCHQKEDDEQKNKETLTKRREYIRTMSKYPPPKGVALAKRP